MPDFIEQIAYARKVAEAVYLATDELVAADISRVIITGLADTLEATQRHLKRSLEDAAGLREMLFVSEDYS